MNSQSTFQQTYDQINLIESTSWMKYLKNITDVVVNALLNSSLKRSKYQLQCLHLLFELFALL
ncbi:hypothetical protein T4E_11139, partial [Trichinella pseudospiralis]